MSSKGDMQKRLQRAESRMRVAEVTAAAYLKNLVAVQGELIDERRRIGRLRDLAGELGRKLAGAEDALDKTLRVLSVTEGRVKEMLERYARVWYRRLGRWLRRYVLRRPGAVEITIKGE